MKPTKQQETGMAIVVITVVIILLFLTSCSTKKTVTEYVFGHDTIVTYVTDTVREIRVQKDTVVDWKVVATHDTIHHEKEKVIVLNEQGDTVSQREWDRLWQKIHEMEQSKHNESRVDSSAYYKARSDSLQRIVDTGKEKTTEKVVNRVTLLDKLLFIAAVGALLVWFWKMK